MRSSAAVSKTMAASISRVRFVTCPSCCQVLAEFANFTVYQCGGCGTILQAKNYGVSRGSMTRESLETNSQDASCRSSSVNESAKETTAHTTAVVKTAPETATDNQNSSLSHFTAKIVISEHGEHMIDSCSADIHTSNLPKQSASVQNEKHATVQDSVARKLGSEDHAPLNVEEEKISRHPNIRYESFKLNERAPEYVEPTKSSEEGADDRGDRQIDTDMGTRKARSYGHDVSSFHVGGNTHSSDNILLLKYQHLGSKEIHEVVEMMPNQGGETTAEAKNELPDDNIRTIPLNQGYTSDNVGGFHASVADKFARRKKNELKDTSLESEDFHSVQNWFDLEKDRSLRHLTMDSVFIEDSLDRHHESTSAKLRNLENVQLQILKKVDDLRDEISGLFHRPVEVKGKYCLRSTDKQNFRRHFRSRLVSQYRRVNEPSLSPHSLYENPKVGYEKENAEIREKRKPVKHHCRPVLGGAPFVICYNCLNLLQLPLDFVVKRKQFYRLQCGNCSKVIMFSFRPRKHDIPLSPNSDRPSDVQHPPTEVSIVSQLGDTHKSDPAFNAEDYELSFGIRHSIDVNELLHDPGASSDPLAERNTEFGKNSKLHGLMGYGSASELLFQQSEADEGFNTKRPTTPHWTSASENKYKRDGNKGKAIVIYSGSTGRNSLDSVESYDEYSLHNRVRTRKAIPPLHRLKKS